MSRRLRPQPPHLIKRDHEDLALAERLARLLDGFNRGGFLGGLAPAEVERWLRRRVVFFAAMRAENLVDDDGLKISRSGTGSNLHKFTSSQNATQCRAGRATQNAK
jgi:hypothetical protein